MKSFWLWLKKIVQPLKKLVELPAALDWVLSVLEPLIVLALTVVFVYAAYCLIFEKSQADNKRITEAVRLLNENWKVGLLLILLLFYRTVRTFLEQAEEFFHIKRRKPRPLPGEPEKPKENPPHTPLMGEPQEPRENP